VLTDRDFVSSALYRNNGLVSYVGSPVIAQDEALGVLNLGAKRPGQIWVWSSRDLHTRSIIHFP
jgi:GAF domain-containing protein